MIRSRLASYKPVDITHSFSAVPRITCSSILYQATEFRFSNKDLANIGGCDLDFILQFGMGSVGGDILRAARYGVWAFSLGDGTPFRSDPPAFWELLLGEPVTSATLRRIGDEPAASVELQRCFISTRRSSHRENLDAITWAVTYMPARVCRDILNGCAHYLGEAMAKPNIGKHRTPNGVEMAKVFFKASITWARQQFESIFFVEDWNVGILASPIHAFLDPGFNPQVEWLAYKRHDTFLADPFLLKVGSRLKLLAEEFDWHSNRGYIVEAELKEDFKLQAFTKALDEGVHMSYPYVFEHAGRWYCTPEKAQKRGVFLYAFDVQSETFKPEATLLEHFAAVDPTLIQYDGRWWMFCTNLDDEVLSKLYIWHAPALLGPWEPHANNPVKMDVRSSRPAGQPFFFRGQLFRPAQNCSEIYGGAVTINRVISLTPQDFFEEPVAHVRPICKGAYRRGIHTLAYQDSTTAVDGKRLIFTPGFVVHRIRHKLQKFLAPRSSRPDA
jgi:hypothetical protein